MIKYNKSSVNLVPEEAMSIIDLMEELNIGYSHVINRMREVEKKQKSWKSNSPSVFTICVVTQGRKFGRKEKSSFYLLPGKEIQDWFKEPIRNKIPSNVLSITDLSKRFKIPFKYVKKILKELKDNTDKDISSNVIHGKKKSEKYEFYYLKSTDKAINLFQGCIKNKDGAIPDNYLSYVNIIHKLDLNVTSGIMLNVFKKAYETEENKDNNYLVMGRKKNTRNESYYLNPTDKSKAFILKAIKALNYVDEKEYSSARDLSNRISIDLKRVSKKMDTLFEKRDEWTGEGVFPIVKKRSMRNGEECLYLLKGDTSLNWFADKFALERDGNFFISVNRSPYVHKPCMA